MTELSTKESLPDTLKWLWPFWKKLKWRLVFLLIATPLGVGFNVLIPMVTKTIFDTLQKEGINPDVLTQQALMMLGLGIMHFLFNTLVQSTRGLTNFYFENAFRQKLSQSLVLLGRGFFYTFRTGDITTRMIDDISEKKLGWFACSGTFRFYQALLTIIGCLYFMFYLNLWLTLATALPLLLVVGFYITSSQKTVGYAKSNQQAISSLNAYLTSTLDGIRIIKSYGQETRAVNAFDKVVEHQYERSIALTKISSLLDISYSRFSELGILTIFGLGGWFVIQGQMTLGTLIAFNSYIFMLIWPMVDIGQFYIKGRQASVSVERVKELEEYPIEIVNSEQSLDLPKGKLNLAFQNVSFSFENKKALDQVNCEFYSGQLTVLAGSVGAGKSLALDMIPRIIEPKSGHILLNGTDIRDFTLADYRKTLGIVTQNPSLFSATIQENIFFGREGLTPADLEIALEVSQLKSELPQFENGLDTLIGQRGVKLSGGQKQRVAIARALVHQPRILILDDCTSALDAETEARFWKALMQFAPEMMVLLVTHRLHTLKKADQIVLLDQGKVVTIGNHETLSDTPLYQELYLNS